MFVLCTGLKYLLANWGHTLPNPTGPKMKDINQKLVLRNRFLLVQFSKEYLWTPSSTWGILSASTINQGRKTQKLGNNGFWCSREAVRQPKEEGHSQVSAPGRDPAACFEVVRALVALTISRHLATTKLKWLRTSVSHDVLDSYRKQNRTEQEHSCGNSLK